MGHKDLLFRKGMDVCCDLPYGRRIAHHLVVDPCEAGDKIRDLAFRVHQAVVLIDDLLAIVFKNSDLGDLVSHDPVPGGLYVDYTVQKMELGE